MRRLLWRTSIGLCAVILLLCVGVAGYVYRVYYAHLDEVARVLSSLPPEEANPPAEFSRVVLALEPEGHVSWVARSFVAATFPERLPMLEWHVRNFIWASLLPRSHSEGEMLSLYAHFLPFRDGAGLSYAAQHRFSQAPHTLTTRQIVELLVISRAPRIYSRPENRERLDSQVESRLIQLGEPAA